MSKPLTRGDPTGQSSSVRNTVPPAEKESALAFLQAIRIAVTGSSQSLATLLAAGTSSHNTGGTGVHPKTKEVMFNVLSGTAYVAVSKTAATTGPQVVSGIIVPRVYDVLDNANIIGSGSITVDVWMFG